MLRIGDKLDGGAAETGLIFEPISFLGEYDVKKSRTIAMAAFLALASQGTAAQFSLRIGADYSNGGYARAGSASQWIVPLVASYGSGPWSLKVNIRYPGVGATDNTHLGGAPWTAKRMRSSPADVFAVGVYDVVAPGTGIGLDVGLKVEFRSLNRGAEPFTAGRQDYSIQADMYRGFGGLTAFGSLGWRKAGKFRWSDVGADFAATDTRPPWYASLGASYKLTDATRVGLAYDWRRKALRNSRQSSEATLFINHALTRSWKLQGYAVGEFSGIGSDWGAGATFGYTW